MSFSLIGQAIDEVNGELDILGQSVVNLKLNNETVWTKRAKAGFIKIGYTGVIEETGTAVGTVHMNSNGDFLFTPPADLYSATIDVHAAGGGGGGGEGGETWGGSDGTGGSGGGAGAENVNNIVGTSPHVPISFKVGGGGSGGAGGPASEDDGQPGIVGGSSNWNGGYSVAGGYGGAGGSGHYVAGGPTPQSAGGKGVDSSIGTGGAGGGTNVVGGTGGHAAGAGGGGGGNHDSSGSGDTGGAGGVGGTGIITITW